MEENNLAQFKPLISAFNLEDFNKTEADRIKKYYIDNGLTPTNKYMREYLN